MPVPGSCDHPPQPHPLQDGSTCLGLGLGREPDFEPEGRCTLAFSQSKSAGRCPSPAGSSLPIQTCADAANRSSEVRGHARPRLGQVVRRGPGCAGPSGLAQTLALSWQRPQAFCLPASPTAAGAAPACQSCSPSTARLWQENNIQHFRAR